MNTPSFSLGQLSAMYRVEQDWLFEKFLMKLAAGRHLMLAADKGWGLQEYVSELGFQLKEKNPDIYVCQADLNQVYSQTSFLDLLQAALSRRFPEMNFQMKSDSNSLERIREPEVIASRKKIRVAVFIGNSHLMHRFKDPSFLRKVRLRLKNQNYCVYCLHGNNNPQFRELIDHPGPLSGIGQVFHLRHDQTKHRSASIRKLFHECDKNIAVTTSQYMSLRVDNHPFYLKLLAWHTLLKTRHTCTRDIIKEAMKDLTHHYDYHFQNLEENLTEKQLGFLKALLHGHRKLFSETVRSEYKLGSSSNIARLKQSLEKKEIVYTAFGEFVFCDPVFREWLRLRHCAEN